MGYVLTTSLRRQNAVHKSYRQSSGAAVGRPCFTCAFSALLPALRGEGGEQRPRAPRPPMARPKRSEGGDRGEGGRPPRGTPRLIRGGLSPGAVAACGAALRPRPLHCRPAGRRSLTKRTESAAWTWKKMTAAGVKGVRGAAPAGPGARSTYPEANGAASGGGAVVGGSGNAVRSCGQRAWAWCT